MIEMMSAEELVKKILSPLDKVYRWMEEEDTRFVLFREHWKCLAKAYHHTVGMIKKELLRMLEPLMATLHALFSVMKDAHKSFLECVAPHAGFSSTGFDWLQSDGQKHITRLLGFGRSKRLEKMRDLRLWMVKHALRHILDCEVPHRHMENLLTTSAAVYGALLHVNYLSLLADARQGKVLPLIYSYGDDDAVLPNAIPVIYTRHTNPDMEAFIRRVRDSSDDMAFAMVFFSSSVANETDGYVSQMILERLGAHHRIDEKPTDDIGRLKMNPTEFQKTGTKLGKGGSGSVRSWSWICEEHEVAVKKGSSGTTEMEIQARVRHPNVLPLLCCTWKEEKQNDEESLLLVMERMDSNLDKLIDDVIHARVHHPIWDMIRGYGRSRQKRPTFRLPMFVEIMLQIAKGMEYLHSQDIIHRDLKPANILVNILPDNVTLRVKIADFGLSKRNFQTSDPANSYKMGTRFYRAPEMMDEESHVGYGRKADVYSFAMVCYRILSGKEPFHDYHSLLQRDLHERIRKEQLRPKFDHESSHYMALVGMVEHCWRHNPSKRPDFAQIAGYLRFIKICVLQSTSMKIFDDSEWRQDLDKLLKNADLFSTFCQRGSSIEDMLRFCASRKINALTSNDPSGVPGET